jgi:hypothetical protein
MQEMLLSVENSLVEGQAALFKSIQQEINIRDITICRLPFHMLAGTDTTRQAIYFRTMITAGDYNRFVVSNTERLEKAFYQFTKGTTGRSFVHTVRMDL